MERRDFVIGTLAVATVALTSSKAEAANPSLLTPDVRSFIRENPELKASVLESLKKDGIEQVRKSIQSFHEYSSLVSSSPVRLNNYNLVLPQWRKCIYVPKEAVVAVGWYYKVTGGLLNLAAIPVASTVAGVPIAVALAALGIGAGWSGDAVLSWADKQSWPKRVCVSVN